MKRTTRRLYRPEISEAEVDREVSLDDVEDRLLLEITISRFRERLSTRAREVLELLLRSAVVDSSAAEDLRREVDLIIGVTRSTTSRKEIEMAEHAAEPNWSALNIRTLREASKEVLGLESTKRTMKSAYGEIREKLLKMDRELLFTCQNCDSLIDDKMDRCWACGLAFKDEVEEETVVEAEVVERARKLGIEVEGKDRANLLKEIEGVEGKTRDARRSVDLLTLESQRLNEQITEEMPDGWSKKTSKQYTAYFDSDRTRRVAIFHRGLKCHFSVDDGFLDGFPDLAFFDEESRRAKHFGRANYEYAGDMAKYAFDLFKRILKKYK
jgi:RNA polymerase subunit RPABC4/transcription elongation factor Spt4